MSKKQNKSKNNEVFEDDEKKLIELREKVANDLNEQANEAKKGGVAQSANIFEANVAKKKNKKKKKEPSKKEKDQKAAQKEEESDESIDEEEEEKRLREQEKDVQIDSSDEEEESPKPKKSAETQIKTNTADKEGEKKGKAKKKDSLQKRKKKGSKDDDEQKKRNEDDEPTDLSTLMKIKKPSDTNYCSLIVIGVLFLVLLVTKFQEEKYRKFMAYNRNEDFGQDYYEILEIDSAASLNDIKKQYKKLALAWHPDKNPNCGKECSEKFNKISTAYEILGNPEKRKQYDETSGVFTPIRSKTISLTSANFHRLVDDSDDLWIIQIYEDGSPRCESFSSIWDDAALKFDGTAKFGRVNAGLNMDVMRKLPFKIHFYPTIIAVSRHQTPDIFTFPHQIASIFSQLKKFIEKNIANNVKYYDSNSFPGLYHEDFPQDSAIYLNTNKESYSLDQKYAAYKYNSYVAFYQSKFGEAKQVAAAMSLNSTDGILFKYKTDNEGKIKKSIAFNSATPKMLKRVVQLSKFISYPEFNRETFKSFCKDESRSISQDNDESSSVSESIKQTICIAIVHDTSDGSRFDQFSKQVRRFQREKIDSIASKIQKSKDLFPNYQSFQLGHIDLAKHKRLSNILKTLQETHGLSKLLAFAVKPTNNKAIFLKPEENFEDWIEDLYENEDENENVIYLNEVLKDHQLEDFLRGKDDSTLSIFYNELINQINTGLNILALITIAVVNKFVLKKPIEFSVVSALVIMSFVCIGTAAYRQREELF